MGSSLYRSRSAEAQAAAAPLQPTSTHYAGTAVSSSAASVAGSSTGPSQTISDGPSTPRRTSKSTTTEVISLLQDQVPSPGGPETMPQKPAAQEKLPWKAAPSKRTDSSEENQLRLQRRAERFKGPNAKPIAPVQIGIVPTPPAPPCPPGLNQPPVRPAQPAPAGAPPVRGSMPLPARMAERPPGDFQGLVAVPEVPAAPRRPHGSQSFSASDGGASSSSATAPPGVTGTAPTPRKSMPSGVQGDRPKTVHAGSEKAAHKQAPRPVEHTAPSRSPRLTPAVAGVLGMANSTRRPPVPPPPPDVREIGAPGVSRAVEVSASKPSAATLDSFLPPPRKKPKLVSNEVELWDTEYARLHQWLQRVWPKLCVHSAEGAQPPPFSDERAEVLERFLRNRVGLAS